MTRALIPTGLGFNCEEESAYAFRRAGAETAVCDIRDLLAGKVDLFSFDALMLCGGFTFADDLGSGKALANVLRFRLMKTPAGEMPFVDAVRRFVSRGSVVLGVCNGFQILTRLGLLPGFASQDCTLAANDSGRFEDRWVSLKVNPRSACVATRGMETMELPVRHGEGKLVFAPGALERVVAGNQHVFQYVDAFGRIAESYPENPNGSPLAIAGLCDVTGRIIGMMPHPEAHVRFEQHPRWTRIRRACREEGRAVPEGAGLQVFRNIVQHCQEVRPCETPLSESS